jgi:hypothetical protein
MKNWTGNRWRKNINPSLFEPIEEKPVLVFDGKNQHALSYHKEDKTFSIWASDFSVGQHKVPQTITVKIKSNNHIKDFKLSDSFKDIEGEITHWIYNAVDGSAFSLFVWND